jgi:nicotinamidase/pyrazinamidase
MKALLIVDIQNDFLPGGALPVAEGDRIVPLVNELMPAYDLVVATQDWHPPNHGSFAANHPGRGVGETLVLDGLDQVLWPVHCVEGSAGAEFAPGLETVRIDHIVRKGGDPRVDSYSGFFDNDRRHSTGMTEYFEEQRVAEVHVVGLATDYCVKFTALDAVREGFQTTLITDACRGVNLSPGDVERAIADMREAGVRIMTSCDILGETVTLYRPVGAAELALLEGADFTAWPPRLPGQPIFYPVTNEAYAAQITREWNVPEGGTSAVTRFEVRREFLRNYRRKIVGGRQHEEYWIPAEDLNELNANIVGTIEVLQTINPTRNS